jgi:hypothetical protein
MCFITCPVVVMQCKRGRNTVEEDLFPTNVQCLVYECGNGCSSFLVYSTASPVSLYGAGLMDTTHNPLYSHMIDTVLGPILVFETKTNLENKNM